MYLKRHNKIILKTASYLKRYAALHYLLKKSYFKLSYFLFADKKFKYKIKNGIRCNSDLLSKDCEYFVGYYHHIPWSYDDRFLVINSILDKGNINVVIFDLDTLKNIFSDKTTLWNYQQGPMSGWVPFKHTIYYNK